MSIAMIQMPHRRANCRVHIAAPGTPRCSRRTLWHWDSLRHYCCLSVHRMDSYITEILAGTSKTHNMHYEVLCGTNRKCTEGLRVLAELFPKQVSVKYLHFLAICHPSKCLANVVTPGGIGMKSGPFPLFPYIS